ncbi:tRNA dihydrouridine synthase DusB [Candidatus Micrarchaeota archaeon]|nr:tRNA dihydrouridine synthase DusB [Candidatus Micrarchaeota archaeon]
MKIGSVEPANNFFLAPMAGFSTPAFRRLCKEYGAGLTTSEMVCCEAVLRGNKTTQRMLARAECETPFAIQVFGSEPKRIALAGQALEKKCDVLDLNFGCPANHVTVQGAGALLLKKPEKIAETLDLLSTLKIPVTAKMRLGFSTKKNCVEIAKLIERGGAKALAVHARTAKQNYSMKADWNSIREIKNALSIPVIGNGDVSTPEDAELMLEKTKCDAVMIGRAALGNPFIFAQMNKYFQEGKHEAPSKQEKMNAFLQFLQYSEDEPVARVKLQAVHFTKGLKNSAETRRNISKAKTVEEIKEIVL